MASKDKINKPTNRSVHPGVGSGGFVTSQTVFCLSNFLAQKKSEISSKNSISSSVVISTPAPVISNLNYPWHIELLM